MAREGRRTITATNRRSREPSGSPTHAEGRLRAGRGHNTAVLGEPQTETAAAPAPADRLLDRA